MTSVKNEFDVILFDCTPMLGISDAAIVTSLVDASLLVVQPRRFPRSMLLRVKNALNDIGATVLGVVLNNVDVRHDHQYRFYMAYGDYYGKARTDRKPVHQAPAKQKAETKSANSDDEY
jgi:Mrp family chromosome partitioning ATPase